MVPRQIIGLEGLEALPADLETMALVGEFDLDRRRAMSHTASQPSLYRGCNAPEESIAREQVPLPVPAGRIHPSARMVIGERPRAAGEGPDPLTLNSMSRCSCISPD